MANTPNLTLREKQILDLLRSSGASNKQIARQLGIAEETVRVHIRALLRKIGCVNRTQAAIWWERQQAAWLSVDVASIRRALQAAITDAGAALAELNRH